MKVLALKYLVRTLSILLWPLPCATTDSIENQLLEVQTVYRYTWSVLKLILWCCDFGSKHFLEAVLRMMRRCAYDCSRIVLLVCTQSFRVFLSSHHFRISMIFEMKSLGWIQKAIYMYRKLFNWNSPWGFLQHGGAWTALIGWKFSQCIFSMTDLAMGMIKFNPLKYFISRWDLSKPILDQLH